MLMTFVDGIIDVDALLAAADDDGDPWGPWAEVHEDAELMTTTAVEKVRWSTTPMPTSLHRRQPAQAEATPTEPTSGKLTPPELTPLEPTLPEQRRLSQRCLSQCLLSLMLPNKHPRFQHPWSNTRRTHIYRCRGSGRLGSNL